MDFIGPLPECEGFDMVLNVNDHFSRRVICIPCKQDTDSEDLAQLFLDHVYAEHGLPRKIISDRGSVFVSQFTRALWDQLGIKGNPSTAYHPQTDGLTERYNQELKTYLRLYVDYHQTDWIRYLKVAQFSYNNTVHSAHGQTPFFAAQGRHPYSGLNPRAKDTVPAATSYAEQLEKVHEEVKAALERSKEEMKATTTNAGKTHANTRKATKSGLKVPTLSPVDPRRRSMNDAMSPSLSPRRLAPQPIAWIFLTLGKSMTSLTNPCSLRITHRPSPTKNNQDHRRLR